MKARKKLRLAGTEVPRIGLGTNRLTRDRVAFVRDAVAAGLGHIDTAHTYTGGESEQTIGAALAPLPEGVVVATKGGWANGRTEAIRSQIDESLRRLRTETIALYYLHRVDPQIPLEESLGAIKEAQDAGKIEHAGVANVDVAQIERARKVLPIAAVQNRYSVSQREHDAVVDHCAREGIVFVPYFPLRATGGHIVDEIAERHRATPEQVALAWLLARAPATLPIPGTLSLEHLKQNLAALELELDEADLHALAD